VRVQALSAPRLIAFPETPSAGIVGLARHAPECPSGYCADSAVLYQATWSWSGGPTSVKSYTNVQSSFTQKQLSAYTSIPVAWTWAYTGTNLSCNGEPILVPQDMMIDTESSPVALDTFVGATASGSNTFEVMVWLGLFGGVSPLSANG